jgi:hypothetical protein
LRPGPPGETIVVMEDLTHQCPYCDLRFTYHNEIKDHIMHDHPARANVVVAIEPHELPHG